MEHLGQETKAQSAIGNHVKHVSDTYGVRLATETEGPHTK